MTVEEKIEVMQAYVDGKQIQVQMLTPSVMWVDTHKPIWDWDTYTYRIKPEVKKPTYRPYKDTDEMIADFKERFKVDVPPYAMPSVWVTGIVERGVTNYVFGYSEHNVLIYNAWRDLDSLFNRYTYLDGSPCGKLVE